MQPQGTPLKPYAFLSSVTAMVSHAKGSWLPLRRSIKELGRSFGKPVWVAELDEEDMKTPTWNPIDIAYRCLEAG